MAVTRCMICAHKKRQWIERACLERPRKVVAAEYQVSYRALRRHYDKGHIRRDVIAARVTTRSAKAGVGILATLDDYRKRIDSALTHTDQIISDFKSDPGVMLAALREQMSQIREATRLLELGGKMTGEIDSAKHSLFVLPQWIEIRDLIFTALERFPEARLAVLNIVTAKLADRATLALPEPEPEPDPGEPIEVESQELPEEETDEDEVEVYADESESPIPADGSV